MSCNQNGTVFCGDIVLEGVSDLKALWPEDLEAVRLFSWVVYFVFQTDFKVYQTYFGLGCQCP